MSNKVSIVHVTEAADAIEAEAADGLSITLTTRKVDGVPLWRIAQQDEERGDTIAAADRLIIFSSDRAPFFATLDDASEFPFILVSLS